MPYKKKEKISLMLYYDYLEQFECLTDEQLRKLIYAMIEFDKNDKEIELDKITKMAFIPIKKRLKLDKKKWIETCQTNSKNAKTAKDSGYVGHVKVDYVLPWYAKGCEVCRYRKRYRNRKRNRKRERE